MREKGREEKEKVKRGEERKGRREEMDTYDNIRC